MPRFLKESEVEKPERMILVQNKVRKAHEEKLKQLKSNLKPFPSIEPRKPDPSEQKYNELMR